MPPHLRPRLCAQCLYKLHHQPSTPYRLLTTATTITTTPSPPLHPLSISTPIHRYPPTQPPSHKPPEYRKSQLHRQYTSLLLSTPLMLLFQHNNLRATEWMSIRREIHIALSKVDTELSAAVNLAPHIKIQAIQTGIFESALLVAEYYDPMKTSPPATGTEKEQQTHYLSAHAHASVKGKKYRQPLRPLLSGPLAVVTFPTVSPQHVRAVLSVLAPKAPTFPAPTRRANPGYYDVGVQGGLQKLLLLGARVEGNVFDGEGVRWVGGLQGMEGLRSQLVQMLGSVGAGVTGTLEGVGRSLWFTVEGRRGMLEEEGKGEVEEGKGEGGS